MSLSRGTVSSLFRISSPSRQWRLSQFLKPLHHLRHRLFQYCNNIESSESVTDNITLVNTCTGVMGMAVVNAAIAAGLYVVPVSFGSEEQSGHTLHICGIEFFVHGPSNTESVLKTLLHEYPNLIVVDYTEPTTFNANAELYCKVGVPFVMGTIGGDMDLLYVAAVDSNTYAFTSPGPQKPANAFLKALKFMESQCPGTFSAYSFGMIACEIDASGEQTVFGFSRELGVSPLQLRATGTKMQLELEDLTDHSFQMFYLTSPDKRIEFVFQHDICDISAHAEGAVDAVFFLAEKIAAKHGKKVYSMNDILRDRNML